VEEVGSYTGGAWRCVCLTEATGTEMPILAQVARINRNCAL
jgi:hypothetical protein